MMENLPEDSRLCITAQLRIGRAMRSEWEHRKTGRVFSHSLIFHYITGEIFTNELAIAILYQKVVLFIRLFEGEISPEKVRNQE